MKSKLIILSFIFSVFTVFSSAQTAPENFVANPSFENYIYCPTGFYNGSSNIYGENVIGWSSPTATTPDYFNQCNNGLGGSVGVPDNNSGSISAQSGVGYSGIVTHWTDDVGKPVNKRWREYIQTTLMLQTGIEYDISYHVALASKSGWSTVNLGAHVSDQQFGNDPSNNPFSGSILPIVITPTFQSSQRITTTNSWVLQSFSFTPSTTGIHYLTIGDFNFDNLPLRTQTVMDNGYAYYYIDDASVTAEGCCPEVLNIDNITYANGTETTVAAGTITAGNNVVVSSGATVNYIASTTIELTDGFSTEPGAEFSASIAACPPQFQQRTVQQFPNVFTPNGDGINDELCILASGGSNWSIEIYNEWGNLLYAGGGPITEVPICAWDGDCNQPFPHCTGAPISDGTYYGLFKLEGCDMPDAAFSQNIYVAGAQYRLAGEEDDELTKQTVRNVSLSESTLEKTVSETDEETTATIYPNPSAGIITVRLPQHESPSTLQVFDARGELVWRMGPTEQTTLNVDISAHPVGVYLLRFLNGNNVFTERFVIR